MSRKEELKRHYQVAHGPEGAELMRHDAEKKGPGMYHTVHGTHKPGSGEHEYQKGRQERHSPESRGGKHATPKGY